ncbi:hypothetical protein [Streptomyces europaeiscabiei]|uniref:hypothetical protein n=1 Tax=Streptomyces europaeiscabiei TaxID=146819 RepID=UPI002E25E138|nr:hypothetical protein OG858_47755 [Streptomyces europaeiscabiei]
MTEGVEFSADEVQRLEQLPNAAHEVKSPLDCELEAGHAGLHVGLAQSEDRGTDGITNWWLRWSDQSREWTHEPTCYTENHDASELCLLPAGHEGAHSWS